MNFANFVVPVNTVGSTSFKIKFLTPMLVDLYATFNNKVSFANDLHTVVVYGKDSSLVCTKKSGENDNGRNSNADGRKKIVLESEKQPFCTVIRGAMTHHFSDEKVADNFSLINDGNASSISEFSRLIYSSQGDRRVVSRKNSVALLVLRMYILKPIR